MAPSNDNAVEDAAKALGLKELAPQVYQDLLQPAAREIGHSLVTVAKAVSIAMAPLEASVWGYGRIKEWVGVTLAAKLAKKDPESIVTPPLNVAAPVLQNIPLVSEEPVLREMYANLLASAMDCSSVENVHPSFAYIIQQMASDEALILSYVAANPNDYAHISFVRSDARHGDLISPAQQTQHEELCKKAGVKNISMADSYIENLIRLRIFKTELQSEVRFQQGGHDEDGEYGASVDHQYVDVIFMSDFGEAFVSVCVRTET